MRAPNQKDRRPPRVSRFLQPAPFAAIFMILTSNLSAQEIPASQDETQNMVASPARAKSLLDTPPTQPQVSCIDNQLTIKADNATFGSVLTAVGGCIGTKIEVPEGAAGERLYTQFGPGPIRETLASLLNSMEYDFVISASQSNPQKIETVLLMRRSGETAPAAPDSGGGHARRAWSENRRNAEAAMRAAREEAGQVEPEAAESATPAAAPAENAAADPPQAPASTPDAPVAETAVVSNSNVSSAAATTAPIPSTQGKSTQDLISNMQQLFEQRRQMTQSQKTTPQ